MTYIEDRLEIAPEKWVRVGDATAAELAAGEELLGRKLDDLAIIADAMRTIVHDANTAGQDLVTIPTAALDVIVRTHDDAPDGFHLPVAMISSIAVAEAADLADRFIDEPDTTRWPLLVRWPADEDDV